MDYEWILGGQNAYEIFLRRAYHILTGGESRRKPAPPSKNKGGNMENTEKTAVGEKPENTAAETAETRPEILSLHSSGADADANPFINGFVTALNEM